MPTLVQKSVAELFGTFVLTFCACGCGGGDHEDVGETSLAFGFVIITMAYSIGRVSGCHVNPAVSLAFLIIGQLSFGEFIAYVISQFIGGLIGALAIFGFMYMSLPSPRTDYMRGTFTDAANTVLTYSVRGYKAGNTFGGLLTEIVLTFIFVYVILNAAEPGSPHSHMAGFIIGGALTLVHLVGIKVTVTSVNPARSFATAITQVAYFDRKDSIEQIWIWILGPMIGGALAPFFYMFLHGEYPSNKPPAVQPPTSAVYPITTGDISSIQK